jgi:hypothetical protein
MGGNVKIWLRIGSSGGSSEPSIPPPPQIGSMILAEVKISSNDE